ncbi:MAG: hypothetical protein ACLGHV_09345, partial [Gammaproteobacteria bacterium]
MNTDSIIQASGYRAALVGCVRTPKGRPRRMIDIVLGVRRDFPDIDLLPGAGHVELDFGSQRCSVAFR